MDESRAIDCPKRLTMCPFSSAPFSFVSCCRGRIYCGGDDDLELSLLLEIFKAGVPNGNRNLP